MGLHCHLNHCKQVRTWKISIHSFFSLDLPISTQNILSQKNCKPCASKPFMWINALILCIISSFTLPVVKSDDTLVNKWDHWSQENWLVDITWCLVYWHVLHNDHYHFCEVVLITWESLVFWLIKLERKAHIQICFYQD